MSERLALQVGAEVVVPAVVWQILPATRQLQTTFQLARLLAAGAGRAR